MVLMIRTTFFSQDFTQLCDQNLFMLHLSDLSIKEGKEELLNRFPEGVIYIDAKDTFQIEVGEDEAFKIFIDKEWENTNVNFYTNNTGKKDVLMDYFKTSKEFELVVYQETPDYVQAESNWSLFGIQTFPEDESYVFIAVKLSVKETK